MADTLHRVRPAWPWWRWALASLSAVALALSLYLGWHQVTGGRVIGCGDGSRCDAVLNSRWSTIGGVVPVSGLAAGVYLAMLVAVFYLGAETEASVRRAAWRALLVLAGAALGGAVWFTAVQKWSVGAFCPYCLATHATGLVLAALLCWRVRRERDVGAPGDETTIGADVSASRPIAGGAAVGFAGVGLVAAAALAVAQVTLSPRGVFRGGEASAHAATNEDGAGPRVGPADAPQVVTLLFDYQCPHCQRLHFMLEETVRRYAGQLAFALRPAPLTPACNPYVTRDTMAFRGSCELARIALAVWVADRAAFAEFDRWMFSLEAGARWRPRSVDAARAHAVGLVGEAKLAAALGDPWVERYLQRSVAIFGQTGENALPKFVLGSRWVTPEPGDARDLAAILAASLALPISAAPE